jgi:hypothetical protein
MDRKYLLQAHPRLEISEPLARIENPRIAAKVALLANRIPGIANQPCRIHDVSAARLREMLL